jgi:hypothetical protein
LISAPNAQTTSASGETAAIAAKESSAWMSGGWMTSMPSDRARSATGGGESFWPRPRFASGRVTTRAGRCSDPASRSNTAAANSDVPR